MNDIKQTSQSRRETYTVVSLFQKHCCYIQNVKFSLSATDSFRNTGAISSERSAAQWLRRCIIKPTVVGSILADATAFTDFVPISKVLKLDCLFPTHGCAEAFILQWIDTAWNLFFYFKVHLNFSYKIAQRVASRGIGLDFLLLLKHHQQLVILSKLRKFSHLRIVAKKLEFRRYI